MTENEKREKEICVTKEDFEISEIIHQTIGCSYKCYECRRYNKECKDYAIVKQLKSYYERKEEEVRKETAKTVLKRFIRAVEDEAGCLFSKIRKRSDTTNLTTIDRFVDFIELVGEEFGVEVELK